MLNSVAAGRQQAKRVLLAQAGIVALLSLGLLAFDPRATLAAVFGGGAATLGSALMAWRTFASGVVGPSQALAGLIGGVALKWLVIMVALSLALARWELPALPLLAGITAAMIAPLLVFRIKS